MVSFVEFLFGFTAMVAFSAAVTWACIGAFVAADRLAWRFRQGSLAREAQRELAKSRVRERRAELESLT